MSWEKVPLGELTRIRTGKLDANAGSIDGEYPFFTCAKKPLKINSYSYDCECVLVAGNGDLNVKHYSGKFDAYQRTYIVEAIQKEDPKFHLRYAYHFLETYLERLREQSIGGIIKYIKLGNLTDAKIPLPPIEEQKRIAKILDAADAQRAKRRESLAQLDALLQSTFLELFGDPVSNQKNWGVSELKDVIEVEHGYAFKSEYFSDVGEYIVLTPGNFYEAGGYRDQGRKTKFYTSEPPSKFILPGGAMLVAMTEQAPGLLGSPLFVPANNRYLHNQRLGRLHLNESVLPEFIFHLFNTSWVRGEIQRSSTGTKVKHTSPSKIGSVVVPIPPLTLQRKFASIVKSIEIQKNRLQVSLLELEALFHALQQQAFTGEL